MAAGSSFMSLFDNPVPESSALMESLSLWNQTKPKARKPIEAATLTEIFGELHFREGPGSPADPPPPSTTPASDRSPRFDVSEHSNGRTESPSLDSLLGAPKDRYGGDTNSKGGFSSKNSESLKLCTEGLGSESSDGGEDLMNEPGNDWRSDYRKDVGDKCVSSIGNINAADGCARNCSDVRSRSCRKFPPPISSIGRSGKPWVFFKSYREGGRFVLREIRIPTQEFLHASREDGRLKLHFVHPHLDIQQQEEEEEEEGGGGGKQDGDEEEEEEDTTK